MARVARAGARVTVVQGRFEHVNFIVEPAPLRVRVLEVVPPEPPKLLEMARAVLDYDEDLPPVELDFVPIDLRELAARAPGRHYLFPCRCAGLDLDARSTSSTPARRSRPTGRSWAASARARSTWRCTAPSRARGSTSARACCAAERRPDADEVLPARARDRARGRRARSCRGARASKRSARRCASWWRRDRLGRLRAPVGDAGDARAVRRRGPHAHLARHHRRARGRAGRARAHPAPRPRARSPALRASSTSRRSARRRGAAATRRSG